MEEKKKVRKEDCPLCKDLPEGEVVKGHDHRNPKQTWKEELHKGEYMPYTRDVEGRLLMKCPKCDKDYEGADLSEVENNARKEVIREVEEDIKQARRDEYQDGHSKGFKEGVRYACRETEKYMATAHGGGDWRRILIQTLNKLQKDGSGSE